MADEDPDEQRDIVARKGNALKSGRGLQIWGSQAGDADDPDASGADPGGGHGNASMGTAERQAKGGYMAKTRDDDAARDEPEA